MDLHDFSRKIAEATKNLSPAERESLRKIFEGVSAEMLQSSAHAIPATGAPAAPAACAHGPGVPDADKQRIFERFTRGDPSRTGKAHFGLGLAVAAEIAALHGAALAVRDTPGGGATFTLRWPARALTARR